MRDFEFDPEKSKRNKQLHGVDLEWAAALWDASHLIIPARSVNGENRFMLVGKMDDKCWAAVFTLRGEAIRLISCHRADRRLERIYASQVEKEN